MKVLLINPNQFREPIGPVAPVALDYLSGPLRAAGHEVKIVDLCFAKDSQLLSLIGDFRADVTGFTLRNIASMSVSVATDFLSRLRALVWHVKGAGLRNIVIGGAGFTVMPRAVFQALPEVDIGVVGEGEVSFVNLLGELAAGKRTFDTPGVIYRTVTGAIVENPRELLNLDDLPARERDTVDNAGYYRSTPYVGVQTKRGCPLLCSYCMDPITYGRRMQGRMRTPAQVADEFAYLSAQGIKAIWMADAEFNLPPQHALEVSRELARRKNDVVWYCGMRPVVNTVPDELFEIMRAANCREVMLTIDSVSPKVARANGFAGQTKDSVLEAAHRLRKHGFPVIFILLVGLPEQGPAELEETLDFISIVRPHVTFFGTAVRIYPGTPMEAIALREGIIQPGWNPLEEVFYRPEYVNEQLVPLIQRRMATEPDWILMNDDLRFGEVRERMIASRRFRGSNYDTYLYAKQHRAWVAANVLGLKLRSYLDAKAERVRKRLRLTH